MDSSARPSDVAGLSLGYDRFAFWLYKHSDAIHKLMKIAAETIVEWVSTQREVVSSDLLTFISGDTDCFMNPEQFKEFSIPYLKDVCCKLRKKNNVVLYHNDGGHHSPLSHAERGMAAHTSLENIWMIITAKKYGRYPLSVRRR